MDSFKILIVEDEVIIAEMLRSKLRKIGYSDTDRCKGYIEARGLIKSKSYSLVILDINLEGEREGIQLGELCSNLAIPFFYLTSYSDRNTILKATGTRPGNYLVKPFSSKDILVAIEMTLMHQRPKEEARFSKMVELFELSNREEEVLKLVYERHSYEEISQKLYLSINTIKSHIKNLYNKMGVSSKQELISLVQS